MHEYALSENYIKKPGWLVNLLGVVITTPFVGVYDNPYEREGIFNHLVYIMRWDKGIVYHFIYIYIAIK